MPDQKTQNPTGNNPPPQNPLANDMQSAHEAAWLRLRDQGKTPSDVSSMMADLSAEDFNALSSAVTEAKRYGRKEVVYKGFKLPVPDKSALLLRKNFEERQMAIQSQIEQANKGLGQQIFGTGLGGIGTELGKLMGLKPKKATKGQKNKDQGPNTKDEEKTDKIDEKPKQVEEKKTVDEEEFETSDESELGPTGTLRIQTPETATGPTGTLKMATAAAIPASTKGGTVRIPQNTKGGTLKIPNQTKGGTLRMEVPTKGGTVRMPTATKGGTVRIPTETKGGTVRLPTGTRGGTVRTPAATGPTGTVRIPTSAKSGTIKLPTAAPSTSATPTLQGIGPAAGTTTLKGMGPTPSKTATLRGVAPPAQQPTAPLVSEEDFKRDVTKHVEFLRSMAAKEELTVEDAAAVAQAEDAILHKATKTGYSDALFENKELDRYGDAVRDRINGDRKLSKRYRMEALVPHVGEDKALEMATKAMEEDEKTAADFAKTAIGKKLIVKDADDTFSEREVSGAEMDQDGRYKIVLENPTTEGRPAGYTVEYFTPLQLEQFIHSQKLYELKRGKMVAGSDVEPSPIVSTAAMAAGIAGAALGATVETASTPSPATVDNVSVSKESKISISAPQETEQTASQGTGIESIEVDKERKVTTSTVIAPPTTAPQSPQAKIDSVEVQHQGKITTQATQPAVASPTDRQESRVAFRMPGAPPPSAPPTGGQPKGPSAPRPMSSADLLSQADQLVEQTKKFTSRMAVNTSDVMLKAQMRGLREQASSLRANIANTQKAGSIFAPESAALSRLDDRLGMIEGSLMGDVGTGASVELATGLGLYDRERPEIGSTLSPTSPIIAPRRVAAPRPTGIGAPPVAGGAVATTGRAFPGPRPPRPLTGTAPQRSGMNQMNAAMQLGAAQQQAALQGMDTEEYGEEQLIGDSSVPPDVRTEALSQVGGVQQGGGILPGQYAPRGYEDVYGGGISPQHVSRSERAPGAAYEEDEELSEEQMAEEGGELGSDEAERARVLAEQQAAARRAADFSGAPGMAGQKKQKTGPAQPPKPTPKPAPGPKTGAGPSATGGAGKTAAAGASPAQIAALLAAQKAKSVLTNTLAKNEAIRRQIEGLQNIQKNLQHIWRIVNASELMSAEAVFPIIMWIATSNIQLINKYSFKVQFIPPATIVEDGFTFCVDCLLGSNCLMNLLMYIAIAVLITLPYIVAGGVATGILGALGTDPVQAMIHAMDLLAK